jgi:surface polysaccharide O-acyltransferase-like enzyme
MLDFKYMKQWIEREKYIVMNGQPRMFRIIKWIVLVILGALIYVFFDGKVLGLVILALAIAGVFAHFLFRWKTNGWTQNWWLYKVIKTPFDENL